MSDFTALLALGIQGFTKLLTLASQNSHQNYTGLSDFAELVTPSSQNQQHYWHWVVRLHSIVDIRLSDFTALLTSGNQNSQCWWQRLVRLRSIFDTLWSVFTELLTSVNQTSQSWHRVVTLRRVVDTDGQTSQGCWNCVARLHSVVDTG
jgi:hypothetical protein